MPKRKILSLLSSLLLAVGLVLFNQAPASASANGCDAWSAGEWLGKLIPGGVLCHQIRGSGRTITVEYADAGAVRLCNWHIDFRYYKTDGSLYRVSTGATHNTCTSGPERYIYPGTLPYYGRACAYIYSNGKYLTAQCHSITA